MPAIAIIGAQWGDEGKGAVTDRESELANLVVRFNGGANAGHSLVVGSKRKKIVTHILPSGIVRKGKINLVGSLVACDLEMIKQELRVAKRFGAQVKLDPRAPVVLPIHKLLDGVQEEQRGSCAIGTTKRGIGPCYSDHWARRGLKLGDLTSVDSIRAALGRGGYYQEKLALAKYYGFEAPTLDETVAWCARFIRMIKPMLTDTVAMVHLALAAGNRVLFEGAQGVLLDPCAGTYPYTTSSPCTLAGINLSFGVYNFDRVIGVTKAYTTRVGAGPFPTELTDEIGEYLRQKGHEFGATTGRPRRCGWLDLVALRYACRKGGITELFITKLDVLAGFDPILYCDQYARGSETLSKFDTLTTEVMEQVEPRMISPINGLDWEGIRDCRHFQSLPLPAQIYLKTISEFTKIPITGVGVGPGRDEWFAT